MCTKEYQERARTSNNLTAFDDLVRMKASEDCNAEMADVIIAFLKTCDGVVGPPQQKGINDLMVNGDTIITTKNRFAIDALLKPHAPINKQ